MGTSVQLYDSIASVVFRNVGLTYCPGSTPALEDVSFAIPHGTSVGIYGPGGSGKSTLMRLLARCYDPTSGAIALHGVNLRHYSLAQVRSTVSFLPRYPLLFSGTIGDNIAYSRLQVSRDEIVAAAKAVDIHRFIVHNPRGYDAQIGNRGCLLTGSQRQLVALAREYLKNPQLLVLDDPMAMSVNGIDNDVLQAIKRISHNRTTFVASRDLQSLAHCDLILKIDRGRLVSVNADVDAAACVTEEFAHATPMKRRDGAGHGV
jgi:ABC-type multidrug transport system fused ATPase/permease subunit